jgi:hypothetical protein
LDQTSERATYQESQRPARVEGFPGVENQYVQPEGHAKADYTSQYPPSGSLEVTSKSKPLHKACHGTNANANPRIPKPEMA